MDESYSHPLPRGLVNHVSPKLDAAVLSFSDAFDMSPIDLRQWAYAQMVLGAWWSFDEMPEHYDDATVAKADIWNV